MYPPTHVAFTYLAGRKFLAAPIRGAEVWALALTTLLPDIIDKTLHYHFGLFASGRNIFHNIFIVLISYGIYRLITIDRWKRRSLIVFLGLATHFIGDIIPALIRWTYTDYSSVGDWYLYILFPLFDPQLLPIHLDWFEVTWELILILIVLRLWIRDGLPGFFHIQKTGRI